MTGEVWSSSAAYDGYVGRWSRPVAERFVAWLAPPPGVDWAEVGCGTGALTQAVLGAEPSRLLAVDPSADFISGARARIGDERVEFRVGDGMALPLADAAANYVVSGLVLNFIPDPATAVGEMRRVSRDGATIAAYVWDYAEGMQAMRAFWDAAIALDPGAADHDEAVRFPLCHPDRLRELFTTCGLSDVQTGEITVPTTFADFDDYWQPFLHGHFPAPAYCASLSEPARDRLRERLRRALARDGGPLHLTARAWAVRGLSKR